MTEVDTRSAELYCAKSCHHHVLLHFEAIQRVCTIVAKSLEQKYKFMKDGANVSGYVFALYCNEARTDVSPLSKHLANT